MRKRLIEYYPERLQNSEEFAAIQEALEEASWALWEGKDLFLAQNNVQTATAPGLDKWEEMLGIYTHTGTDAARRERIRLKLHRPATTTVEEIRKLCEIYEIENVEITEKYADYTVKLTFDKKEPRRMVDLQDAIERIKPAHLKFEYEIIYYTHGDLTAWTHGDLAVNTHENVRKHGGNEPDA